MHAYKSPLFLLAGLAVLAAGTTSTAQGPPVQAAQVVDRARAAHGGRAAGETDDWAAEGKVTLFSTEGAKATFDMKLLRKGPAQVQRVIVQPGGDVRQGSDGTRTWESAGGFFTPAAQGHALQFIESQTVRSPKRLFNHQAEGMTLRDLGMKGNASVIEAEDRQGRKTSYFVDSKTSVIDKMEFVTGTARDPFTGNPLTVTDTYVFSDYRMVQGVLTPFKVERYNGRIKTEEMQFSSVRHNAGVKDQEFKR